MRGLSHRRLAYPALLALVLPACGGGPSAEAGSAEDSGPDDCEPIEVAIEPDTLVEPYGLTAEQIASDLLIGWEGQGVWMTSDLVDAVPWSEPSPFSLAHTAHSYSIETRCETRRLLIDSVLSVSVDGSMLLEKPARAFGGLRREGEDWDELPGFLELVDAREELESAGVVFAKLGEGSLGATMTIQFLPDSKEASVVARHSVQVTEDLEMVQTAVVVEVALSPNGE